MGLAGMPDTIRTVESCGARPQGSALRIAVAIGVGTLLPHATATAGDAGVTQGTTTLAAFIAAFALLDRHEIAALALTLGILCFAVVTAILLVRTRARLGAVEAAARDETIAAKAAIDRAYGLLLSEPQVLVAWAAAAEAPEIVGDPTSVTGGDASTRVLAFRTWLEPEIAREIEHSVDALRARGVSFGMTLTTRAGRIVEAEGHVIGGRAILRLREVSGIKYELAELSARHQKQIDDAAAMRALIEAVPAPVWARDETGKLVFANQAYARAVDAKEGAAAIERGIELFDRVARTELLRAHETGQLFSARLPAVVAGQRRSFDVLTVPAARGSAGIGIDATAAELMRAELARMMDAHRRTLDQLATGVAIFGSNQRLSFYNAAYRRSGISIRSSSTRVRPIRPCSTSCAPPASSRTSTITGSGRPPCTRPTARSRPRSTCGTCRTAAPCARSPLPTRRAA